MIPPMPDRLPLDNAAQIFPSVFSPRETTMSRIGMTLDAPIDRSRMEKALASVIRRFPYFQVYLKKGFSGYYLEKTGDIPPLEEDTCWTNGYVNFHRDRFLFRLKIREAHIAIESSHILTDGFGTLALLYSLLAEYYRMEGVTAGASPFLFRPEDPVEPGEWECGYKAGFSDQGPPQKVPPPAYMLTGELIPRNTYYSTRIRMDREQIKSLAREEKVTVYVFMTALYTSCFEDLYLEDIRAGRAKAGLPIRMEMPVNLRKDYPSKTMRNFSYVFSPLVSVERGAHSLRELIHLISDQVRHERHTRSVEAQIARNLRVEKQWFLRKMPRLLKDLIFNIAYTLLARRMFTGVLTNLGEMTPPPGVDQRVLDFDILPCNTPAPGRNSALYSYRGHLEMNIGSSVRDLRLEEAVLGKLRDLGVPCEVRYHRGEPSGDPAD